jgi:spore coat protein SA
LFLIKWNDVKSVVIVVPELLPVPPIHGGAVEHWVDEVSRRMVVHNRRLAVVSRPSGCPGYADIEYIGIPWTTTERCFQWIKSKVTWRNPLRYIAKVQNVFSYGTRVAKAVKDFDVVYLHNEPNVLLMLPRRAGQKLVLHMHNDHLSARLFRPFYRLALKKADLVICVSDYIRKCALAAFPEFKDKFSVIVNSTNPDVFRPYGAQAVQELNGLIALDPALQYVLYVGRLSELKGVHVLIEAFQFIQAHLPNARLIITGSSFFGGAAKTAYEQTLVNLAAPIVNRIVFTGYLAHEKLKYLYSAVDVVCVPSVWQDPCPLVVLEAMGSGTCLVASRVGGVPEMATDGVTAVLVPPAVAEALSDAVCSVLTDPVRKARLESAARADVTQRFGWERLVGELEAELGALN